MRELSFWERVWGFLKPALLFVIALLVVIYLAVYLRMGR
jgi:hypothetical protein